MELSQIRYQLFFFLLARVHLVLNRYRDLWNATRKSPSSPWRSLRRGLCAVFWGLEADSSWSPGSFLVALGKLRVYFGSSPKGYLCSLWEYLCGLRPVQEMNWFKRTTFQENLIIQFTLEAQKGSTDLSRHVKFTSKCGIK